MDKIEEVKNALQNNFEKLENIDPISLEKVYKDMKIKVCINVVSQNYKLKIDMHSLECYENKQDNIFFSKYSKLKSNVIEKLEEYNEEISKLENNIKYLDKKNYEYDEILNQINEKKKYIDDILYVIEKDLEITIKVDNIKVGYKNEHLNNFLIENEGKSVLIKIGDILNNDEFNGKYKMIFRIIDNKYLVSTLSKNEVPEVEYYAHTNIDEVYGLEGNWGLVDINGNTIIKPQYIYPFIECGENFQVMLPHQFKKINGKNVILTLKHGLIDKRGNVIIPIKYLYMEAMDNSGTYFRVADSNTYKSGVIDKNNNIVIPFIYEYIQATPDFDIMTKTKNSWIYPKNIYQVKVCNNDLYGIYDLKLKKEIIKPKYKYLKIIGYNRFLIGEDYDNCNILINECEQK